MDITSLINDGANLWILLPSAILLGALHGLEPGHSKTMMASFIIAIRGSVWQAMMLGIAATISHTAIVWIIALTGLYFGAQYSDGAIEPYLQIASSIIILCVAFWMIRQTYKDQHHFHEHDHHDETFTIGTVIGNVELSIFEENQPPKFRLKTENIDILEQSKVVVKTERSDNTIQSYSFVRKENYLESLEAISEPHEFVARIFITHNYETNLYDVEFVEHNHEHVHEEMAGLDITAPGYQDAHELAHANDIRKRFANQEVTNFQILLFGLTGGLIPCPATITVLLLCLQLKQVTMGAVLVLGFSVGLAITLVMTGTIAALSIHYMSKKFSGFGNIVRKAPYFSSAIIVLIGLYIGYEGFSHLPK